MEASGKHFNAYVAVYLDRGERLNSGKGSLPDQLASIRKQATDRGLTLGQLVGIDVIVGPRQTGKIEEFVTEAERLAHAAFADDPAERTYYVVGLVAKTTRADPRDDPHSARSVITSMIEKGQLELPDAADVTETEHGYAFRISPS
jgi:hypothetical protein